MMAKRARVAVAGALFIGSALLAVAQDRKQSASGSSASPQANAQQVAVANETAGAPTTAARSGAAPRDAARSSIRDARTMRIEGEKRFRANCGRCHMEPHKFPPRVMATVVRHMRVRAMLTEEDTKLILNYITQ